MKTFNKIGSGIYSLSEAQRLTKVPSKRIKRWTCGYTYNYKGELRHTPPIIATKNNHDCYAPTLGFLDLLEVRFLNAFLDHGVSWKAIWIASQRAKELLGRHHPFSTKIFKTDGRTIMAEIVKETGDKVLLDLVKNQYAFEKIIAPFLYSGVEFNQLNEPQRWYPLGEDRFVVLDPDRGFGTPITTLSGVPTRVLFSAFHAEDSVSFVAKWYEVTIQEVRDAIEFETNLAA